MSKSKATSASVSLSAGLPLAVKISFKLANEQKVNNLIKRQPIMAASYASLERLPAPVASKSLKALRRISSLSVPCNLLENNSKKAGKLSGPLASATMALSSASLTFLPSSSKHSLSSLWSIWPSPSLSMTPKAFATNQSFSYILLILIIWLLKIRSMLFILL